MPYFAQQDFQGKPYGDEHVTVRLRSFMPWSSLQGIMVSEESRSAKHGQHGAIDLDSSHNES